MNILGGTIMVPWDQKHNPVSDFTARETLFVIAALPPLNAAKIESYLNERFVNGNFQGCTAITEASYASYESEVAIVIAKAKLPRIGEYLPVCDKPEPKTGTSFMKGTGLFLAATLSIVMFVVALAKLTS